MSELNQTAVAAVSDTTGLSEKYVSELVRRAMARSGTLARVPEGSEEQLVWVAYHAAVRAFEVVKWDNAPS